MKTSLKALMQRIPTLSAGAWVAALLIGPQQALPAGPPTLAAGGYHTVGVKADGTALVAQAPVSVFPDYGQGNVGSWNGLKSVAASASHTVGLRSNGTVVAVGYNFFGQCDVSDWTGMRAVAAAGGCSLGLGSNGMVLATGYNGAGQLNVSSWSNIAAIAAGGRHTVGLKEDGTVVAVGTNDHGQCEVSSWSNVVAIAAGVYHTVGLKNDGTLLATGWNLDGQTNVAAFSNIVAIATGGYHTLGLRPDGTVLAVGANFLDQCVVEGWSNIIEVVGGHGITVGLKADHTVIATGQNEYGQSNVWHWYLGNQPIAPIITLPPRSEVALLNSAATFAVRAAGPETLAYRWLKNESPLADGARIQGATTTTLRLTDVQANDAGNYSVIVSNSFGAATSAVVRLDTTPRPAPRRPAIAAGTLHTLGLKADGTMLALGSNSHGTGQTNVGKWSNIVAIAAGYAHSVGLKPDGSVLAVGWATARQTDVSSWQNVTAVAAGMLHTVGLKANGTVVVATDVQDYARVSGWSNVMAVAAGEGSSLGLASNGIAMASAQCAGFIPAHFACGIEDLGQVIQVAAGAYHSVGLRANGTVIAIGDNNRGACLVSNWTDIIAIAAGIYHTVGLRSDGTVVATGDNSVGACNVAAWSNIVAISANTHRTVGLKADDTAVSAGEYGNDVAVWYLGTNQIRPIITESPTNQVTLIQRPATLRATAAGPGQITYLWLKNGSPLVNDGRISGATTRVVTISSVETNDTADYAIVAFNSYGATTSAVARLQAVLPPAISLGVAGIGPLGFEAQPTFGHWFTYGLPAGFPFSTPAQADAWVQSLGTATITNDLRSTTTFPPQTGAGAAWNSARELLQTRPGGVSFVALMGTFQNDTTESIPWLDVAFDVAAYSVQYEDLPGYRVYFSTSGATNTWQLIPGMAGVTSGPVSATLHVNLAPAGRLYLLWADGNTPGVTDPAYTIDNLTIKPGVRLGIRRLGLNQFDITWPAAVTGLVLKTSDLPDGGTYEPVPEADMPDLQSHHVIVTNLGTRFFQLRRP